MISNISTPVSDFQWNNNELFFKTSTSMPKPSATSETTSSWQNHTITPANLADIASRAEQDLNHSWNTILENVKQRLENEKIDDTAKQALHTIFDKLSLPNLRLFLEHLPELQEAHTALEAVELDKMLAIIQEQHPEQHEILKTLVEQLASCLPAEEQAVDPIENESVSSRSNNFITNFFPNLILTFTRAFNLYQQASPPATLYEYGTLVILYINFFKIPFVLVTGMAALLANAWMALVASLVMMGVTVASIYIYLRWLKPCPSEVSYCVKKETIATRPVQCHKVELQEALRYMREGNQHSPRSVVLIGHRGVGKSELFNAIAADCKEKKCFFFDNCQLFGKVINYLSPAQRMLTAFVEVIGYEDEVVFFLDELGDAARDKFDDVVHVFKTMQQHHKKIRLVAAMTQEQWEELVNKDAALADRFKPIQVNATGDAETLRIIEDEARMSYSDKQITREAFEEIVKSTNTKNAQSQPRMALQALEDLCAGEVANSKQAQLLKVETELANLKAWSSRIDSPTRNPFSVKYNAYFRKMASLETEIAALKKEYAEEKKNSESLKHYLELDKQWMQQRDQAVRMLSSAREMTLEEKQRWQKKLLFINFFAFKKIQMCINALQKQLPPGSGGYIATTIAQGLNK